MANLLVKKSLSLSGHRTSIALEPEFWDVLEALAARRQLGLAALIAQIDAARAERSLASALRVYALLATNQFVQISGASPTS